MISVYILWCPLVFFYFLCPFFCIVFCYIIFIVFFQLSVVCFVCVSTSWLWSFMRYGRCSIALLWVDGVGKRSPLPGQQGCGGTQAPQWLPFENSSRYASRHSHILSVHAFWTLWMLHVTSVVTNLSPALFWGWFIGLAYYHDGLYSFVKALFSKCLVLWLHLGPCLRLFQAS